MDVSLNLLIQHVLRQHIDQISRNIQALADGLEALNFTIYPESFHIALAQKMKEVFRKEPTLLELKPPLTIVGDLHGHLLNLYQILKTRDLPPNTTYLFLGDIVDRGPFSLETLTLIFVLKLCFPDNVYLIRGNHEFSCVSLNGGFFEEITSVYRSQNIFNEICSTFEYIPIGAKIGPYLCLHGGISPDLKTLDQISNLERPIPLYDESIICGATWSDPVDDLLTFQASTRGVGFLFGKPQLLKFLDSNHLLALIRGHECVDGCEFRFDNRCITIFSASNYCGLSQNHSAILQILEDFSLKPIKMPFLKYIKRNMAVFKVDQDAMNLLNPKPRVLTFKTTAKNYSLPLHDRIPIPPKSKSINVSKSTNTSPSLSVSRSISSPWMMNASKSMDQGNMQEALYLSKLSMNNQTPAARNYNMKMHSMVNINKRHGSTIVRKNILPVKSCQNVKLPSFSLNQQSQSTVV
ncbi:Ser/Thr protein phosphatase [Tritrichomonas foetus]|uniref:Serine/threonine-protein phosphatase n=1 Tax=Tritrichomonas foetus TaxID=1144522 RepID=A0A1J4JDP2_9EUKA|nr:Ser/Thr protein phosphatase [Tritrichomonas foetus]|eukprot:OHS96407.1 Ser/Thr protein phosphatase [Tritrichomonas foetus]